MRRFVAPLVFVAAWSVSARAFVAVDKKADQSLAYIGGTVAYDISVTRQFETGLVLHDATPPGHQLMTVQSALIPSTAARSPAARSAPP